MSDVVFGTSGSTGESKSVVRTEESLREDAKMLVAALPELWGPRPAVVSTVRPEHMYGALWRVRAPAVAGCAVDPVVVLSVEELAAAVGRNGRALLVTTPSFLVKALQHPAFASLKGAVSAVVTSGSLLKEETSLAVAETLGVCPVEIFGSTETGSVAFRRRIEGEEWTLFPGVGADVSADGRLVVDSPFAAERPFAMPDIVTISAPGRFVLHGRADRRVKILERYVSLTAVERAFSGHPFVSAVRVEAFGDGVQRIGALVVPSAEGRAALAGGTYSAAASRLRRDLLAEVGELAFPRRIRFVRELPVNEQGKTTVAAVRLALSAWCQEPVVLEWSATDAALSAKLVFPPDAICFSGHFPGFPVLPGVAQIFFLRHFARQVFADFPDAADWRRLKFQKIATPGKVLELSVVRKGEGTFDFSFRIDTGQCSSGTVEGVAQ